jgi:hypothetical protein
VSTFFRYDGSVNAANGFALSGVEIYVCTQPATTTTIPPSPLATIYSDNAGQDPIEQSTAPLETDGNGNFSFYAATGTYTIVYYDPLGRITPNPTVFPDQQVVSQGGGSVTSVALTMDGVIFNSTVSGSPISSSGTLAPALLTQNAKTFLAGPTSGSAAAPTFRAIQAADLPSGAGTVTSVAIALSGSTLLSLSVSGSPITSSGTITLTINFANQSANTVLAGPSSGSATAPTFRALVAADIWSVTALSAGATQALNLATAAWPVFTIPLNQNMSFTVSNPTPGQHFTIKWTQNSPGGYTVTYPATFFGQTAPDQDSGAVTVQEFVCISSTEFRATDTGSTNQS